MRLPAASLLIVTLPNRSPWGGRRESGADRARQAHPKVPMQVLSRLGEGRIPLKQPEGNVSVPAPVLVTVTDCAALVWPTGTPRGIEARRGRLSVAPAGHEESSHSSQATRW